MIDHIITNDVEHTVTPFVIQRSITDHYAVMCKISKTQTSYNRTPSPLYRNKKKFCAEAFSAELDQELGNPVANKFPLNHNIFDDVFDQFVNIIEKTIDKHAPLERMSRKQ